MDPLFISVTACHSVESYTDFVEELTRTLSRESTRRVVALCIQSGDESYAGDKGSSRPSLEMMRRWEHALEQLWRCPNPLLVFIDGPMSEIQLSLALICDLRFGTDATRVTPTCMRHSPPPMWRLASLAHHTGVLRAQHMILSGERQPEQLVGCGLFHSILPSRIQFQTQVSALRLGANAPLVLLRRIISECYSLVREDQIGHALAANALRATTLVSEEAIASEAALALNASLMPLTVKVDAGERCWEILLPAQVEKVAVRELMASIKDLSKKLEVATNKGEPLPEYLVIRLVVEPGAQDQDIPLQLMQLLAGVADAQTAAVKWVKWLTEWEKVLAAISTIPLPTVAHLVGDGIANAGAMQIAFACDVRVAQKTVKFRFASGGLVPGTLTFKLPKHVGASRAMAMFALDEPFEPEQAKEWGALQMVDDTVDMPKMGLQGAALMLNRSLLDGVWHLGKSEMQERLSLWKPEVASHESPEASRGDGHTLSTKQQEQIASFFPCQFAMTADSWQWRASFTTPQGTRFQDVQVAPADQEVPVTANESQRVLIAQIKDGVVTEALCRELLAICHAFSSNMAHGARVFYIRFPQDGGELRLSSAQLLPLWAEVLEAISKVPVPSWAQLDGLVNALALELALACDHRVIAGNASVVLHGWHKDMHLPGARVWELARSAGVGKLNWAMLCDVSVGWKELCAWGLVDAVCKNGDDAEDHVRKQLRESLAYNSADTGTGSSGSSDGESEMGESHPDTDSQPRRSSKRSSTAMDLYKDGKLTISDVQQWERCIRALVHQLPQIEAGSSFAVVTELVKDFPPLPVEPAPEPDDIHALQLRREGNIAIITINRPTKANAYNSEILETLHKLIKQLQDERVAAVLFTSSNPRFWCAGADLERVANPGARDALFMKSQTTFEALAQAPFASIAVIEGSAVAGGFEWALACDYRIAGPQARMWLPETALGLIPAAGGCTRLTGLVGTAKAKQMIMFQQRLDASKALDWGVVQQLEDNPLAAAMALARSIAKRNSSMAMALAKQTIDNARGENSGSLRMERVTEGLLYELKRKPRAVIEGVGLSAPDEAYSQEQVADLLKIRDPRIRALFASGGHIATRCLAEMEAEQKMEASEVTQGYLTKKHVKWAKKMAEDAIPTACEAAGVQMSDIEFIVVCTTTGFVSPGLSAHVVQHLGLSQFIQRVDIVGMGCHAGLNTMFTAAHWAESHPGAVALMFCVEVVSAAYMWDPANPDISEALTNSLFGDGSAAAILRCPVPDPKPLPRGAAMSPRPSLWGFESMILPDSLETLCYFWDDSRHKNSFIIQPQVPYVMGITIPKMIERLLNRFSIKKSQVAHWIAHSGGKKVLDSAMYALGLEKYHFRHSVNSLRKMGNMSSGSFLWSYQSLLEEGGCQEGDFGVFLTMGPGAGLECALWRFE